MENRDVQMTAFETRLQSLNDADLVTQVQSLFQREKRIGDAIILGLKEIKSRRLFAAMGYSSLFEFLVKHFGLSESASYQRLQALKLIEAVPEVQGDLFAGTLSLSNAALVQSFIQNQEKEVSLNLEDKKELIASVKGKTHREARLTLAKENPNASLPPSREKVMTSTHSQLQITVDQETLARLQEVKELLSHTIPDGNLAEVLKYMLALTTQTLKKRKARSEPQGNKRGDAIRGTRMPSFKTREDQEISFSSPTAQCDTDKKKSCVRSRYIPLDIKRNVFTRAGDCCEYRSSDGKLCQSRFQLEIDHKTPWSQGGTHDVESLQILCKTHNLYRTKETHGYWYKP